MDLKAKWNQCDIYVHLGDITALEVDAVVNAANNLLLPGGGVCGAIRLKGGPAIAAECAGWTAKHGSVPVGGAAITGGGKLPARNIIHAVGPLYAECDLQRADELLAQAYRSSLRVAREYHLRTIAFPCISTGIYGFPPERACPVAIQAVRDELLTHNAMERVIFCTFLESDFTLYQGELDKPAAQSNADRS